VPPCFLPLVHPFSYLHLPFLLPPVPFLSPYVPFVNFYLFRSITSTCISMINKYWGPSLPLSYSSWIYNYLCNQCLSPPKLWVWIPLMARYT
jgi:hypothetical protein